MFLSLNEMIGSSRDWAVHARESDRRTVLIEERERHRMTCGLLEGERSLEVVKIRRGEVRVCSFDLDACCSRSKAKVSVIALRAVFDGL
jgi:hypothetical protein